MNKFLILASIVVAASASSPVIHPHGGLSDVFGRNDGISLSHLNFDGSPLIHGGFGGLSDDEIHGGLDGRFSKELSKIHSGIFDGIHGGIHSGIHGGVGFGGRARVLPAKLVYRKLGQYAGLGLGLDGHGIGLNSLVGGDSGVLGLGDFSSGIIGANIGYGDIHKKKK